jgi:hypothetical protein
MEFYANSLIFNKFPNKNITSISVQLVLAENSHIKQSKKKSGAKATCTAILL